MLNSSQLVQFPTSSGRYYNTSLSAISIDNSITLACGTGNTLVKTDDKINTSLSWSTMMNLHSHVASLGELGLWDINYNDRFKKFICIKKTDKNGVRYGWIEANSSGVLNLIVYQQAFNKNYNQIIRVAQTQ